MSDEQIEAWREELLQLSGMCKGPYDTVHRCSALHCDYCGICDLSEAILDMLTAAHAEGEREGRIAEQKKHQKELNEMGEKLIEAEQIIDAALEGQK